MLKPLWGELEMLDEVREILGSTLKLGNRTATLTADTPLLGNLPEMDSMAVVSIVAAIEEHYGFSVADDEISADTFATLGTLAKFVESKLNA
jgi:acyl carrier protein